MFITSHPIKCFNIPASQHAKRFTFIFSSSKMGLQYSHRTMHSGSQSVLPSSIHLPFFTIVVIVFQSWSKFVLQYPLHTPLFRFDNLIIVFQSKSRYFLLQHIHKTHRIHSLFQSSRHSLLSYAVRSSVPLFPCRFHSQFYLFSSKILFTMMMDFPGYPIFVGRGTPSS